MVLNTRLLSIFVTVLCGFSGPIAVEAGVDFPVEVTVPKNHGSVEARLVLTMANADGKFLVHTNPLRAPETLDFKFVGGKTLEMRVEAAGYWSAPQLFITRETDKPIVFDLLPTGQIRGRILVDDQEKVPADLNVRFESTPDKGQAQKIPQSHVNCSVTDGKLACEIPAGLLDVRLKAQGFLPQYLWGISVEDGKELDLASFVLKRGGSVAGRVAIDEHPKWQKVRVALEPIQATYDTSYRANKRFGQLVNSGTINEQGFFQLADVPPGQFWLSANLEGVGESFRFPVKVYKDSETVIEEALVLRKPAALSVSIHPPLDFYQKPWKVELYQGRLGAASIEPVEQAQCTDDGTFKASGLQAGTYQLAVLDSSAARWLMESIEVGGESGELHEEQIVIDSLPVTGRVLYGDEPLVAKLWFGGKRGTRSIEMATGADGGFAGFLPEEGEWVVEISANEPRLRYRRVMVEVFKREGNSTAEVEIELPTQLVEGEVLDAEEAPISNAAVFLMKPTTVLGTPPQERTDDEGRFSFSGIGEGEYSLQAYRGGAQGLQPSSQEIVNVSKAKSSPFVTLKFERSLVLRGRVMSPNGSVPGAAVMARPTSVSGKLNVMIKPNDQTDVDGRFMLTLPEDTVAVDVTITPPGFCLTAARVAIDDDETEVTIPIYDTCGALALQGDDGLGLAEFGRYFTVEQNDVMLDMGELSRWAGYYGGEGAGEVRFPRLALGRYKVCQVLGETPCVTGFVSPGGELRMDVSKKGSEDESL